MRVKRHVLFAFLCLVPKGSFAQGLLTKLSSGVDDVAGVGSKIYNAIDDATSLPQELGNTAHHAVLPQQGLDVWHQIPYPAPSLKDEGVKRSSLPTFLLDSAKDWILSQTDLQVVYMKSLDEAEASLEKLSMPRKIRWWQRWWYRIPLPLIKIQAQGQVLEREHELNRLLYGVHEVVKAFRAKQKEDASQTIRLGIAKADLQFIAAKVDAGGRVGNYWSDYYNARDFLERESEKVKMFEQFLRPPLLSEMQRRDRFPGDIEGLQQLIQERRSELEEVSTMYAKLGNVRDLQPQRTRSSILPSIAAPLNIPSPAQMGRL